MYPPPTAAQRGFGVDEMRSMVVFDFLHGCV